MPYYTNMMTSSDLSDSIKVIYAAEFESALRKKSLLDLIVSSCAKPHLNIQAGSKKITEYSEMALSITELTEDEDVTPSTIADAIHTLNPKEYGGVLAYTNKIRVESAGMIDSAVLQEIAENARASKEKLLMLVLEAAANVYYPNGKTTEGSLIASDTAEAEDIFKMRTLLRKAKVKPCFGTKYLSIIDPLIAHDMKRESGDGNWQDVTGKLQDFQLLNNIISDFGGFIWADSDFITTNTDAGDGTVDTYHSIMLGKDALFYAESIPIRLVIKDGTDNLGRFYRVGWYGMFDFSIFRQEAIRIYTTAASLGSNS